MRVIPLWFVGFLLAVPASNAAGSQFIPTPPRSWLGVDGNPLPFQSDEEALNFLRTASVVSLERLDEGVNRPYKIVLEKDGIRLHAVFRDVRVKMDRRRTPRGIEADFRDDAVFEVAAYELSRLLGLTLVPPAIERRILGRSGSLQLWIENAFTEKGRAENGRKPDNGAFWLCQYDEMTLFDNLIGNDDRNQGNMLFDPSWNRWLVDHTRAFQKHRKLHNPDRLARCGRDLWFRLQNLDRAALEKALGTQLTSEQVKAILARRDLIVEHLQRRIHQWGEGSVLVDECAD